MNISEELDDQPNWRNREELDAEEQDADVLDVARKCMEAHTRHQPPLPVNTEINDLLDSVKNSTDPWLQFLCVRIIVFRRSLSNFALIAKRYSFIVCREYRRLSTSSIMQFQYIPGIGLHGHYSGNVLTLQKQYVMYSFGGTDTHSVQQLTDALTNIDLPLDHPLPQMFQIKIMNELHTATDVELQLCDRLLGTDYFPDNLWLMGQRGRALYDTLELTKAETQFEKMFTLHPDRIEDLDVYSNILHLRGSREKLTALAEKFLLIDKNRPEVCCIVDVNKKDSRPWAGLGAAYDAMGMPQYGLFYYQQAMKLRSVALLPFTTNHSFAHSRPCESYIWEGLGSCYEQLAKHRDSIFALERAIELSKASVPSNRKIVIRAKIVKLARLVGDKEETLAQELKFIKICDDELFGVNLRPPRDNLAEQYITCVYSVAEYHESNDGNLKLAYDYYNWLFVLDPSTVRAKPTMREQIKSKASAKGYDLTNTNSLQFGYSLDYKKGRCLLLEFLQQTGQVTDV
ncbi:hypothetical protein HHX47_DHR1001546 [Lentinula edodes]|nr:hypothetical protein HHX47_DHR1001546 [Lentinula edodes]